MNPDEDKEIELLWKELMDKLNIDFPDIENLTDIAFLIGVQELGQGYRTFSKDEKLDLMHVGICVLLASFGHYSYRGRDSEGWPHFTLVKSLPEMSEKEKEDYLKRAVLSYFERKDKDHSG